jgi:hypothetical protein
VRSMYWPSVTLLDRKHSNSALSWTYTASTSIAKSAIGAAAFNYFVYCTVSRGRGQKCRWDRTQGDTKKVSTHTDD